jgi:hypothetical protein
MRPAERGWFPEGMLANRRAAVRIDPPSEMSGAVIPGAKEVLFMKLSARFAVGNVVVIAGAFLAIVAMAFRAQVAGWIGFGVFTGLALLAFAMAAAVGKISRKCVYALIGLVGLWSLIAALVFSGTVLTWLIFAGGVAMAVIALGDLTAHEVTTENVVHRLEVTGPAHAGSASGDGRPERVAA